MVSGATIIDGVSNRPIQGHALLIEGTRIKAIGRRDELSALAATRTIDVPGKYVIPGLMNANVHLYAAISAERLALHMNHYEDVITEAAQVALKSGLTTVFDTWGPRRPLMTVRDRINAGSTHGSRIFCAGNIVGFDGPVSPDFQLFSGSAGAVSTTLAKRVNAVWVENVGRHLMWLTPEDVAREVRAYISKGINFIKYGSNEHGAQAAGAFLAFSPRVQVAIVEEAHRAGITAQAHTMSVEGLRIAIEAGCDLIQHPTSTGPTPIPESTLELMVRRKTGAVVFPYTQRWLEWARKKESYAALRGSAEWRAAEVNVRNLIRSGAPILLGNDGSIPAPETQANHDSDVDVNQDNPNLLGTGHFTWFKAMEEQGCPPMQMLRAATRNIAIAYGKTKDLGTLEPGKIADVLILDKNPLQAAQHYRSIYMVLKDGVPVDREVLPGNPILTRHAAPAEEEASYVPFLSSGKFPM